MIPAIIINGTNIHSKKIINPAKITKIWNKIPAIIKTILIKAPIILENILEISVLKNSPILNPLG